MIYAGNFLIVRVGEKIAIRDLAHGEALEIDSVVFEAAIKEFFAKYS